MAGHPDIQFRTGDLSAAAAAREQRARFVGVARSGVPAEQLDSAVLARSSSCSSTMFPTLSEAVTGERITIGPPFFNRWMVPIGLILLLLTGIGPLLAWRKTTLLEPAVPVPVAGRAGAADQAVARRGPWHPRLVVRSSASCFAGFVFGTIFQEFWRGAVIRRRSTGTDLLTATIGLVGRSRRRYGGYIVHVGIVLMFLGFAGQGYKQVDQVLLKPGQQTTLGDYTVRMDDLRVTQDSQKQMVTGHFTVFRNGTEIGEDVPGSLVLQQARRADDRSRHPAHDRAKTFIVNMPSYQVSEQVGEPRDHDQPARQLDLARLRDHGHRHGHRTSAERTFAFAMAKFPAPEVATTTTALLFDAEPGGTCLRPGRGRGCLRYRPKDPLEKRLRSEIVCASGCSPRARQLRHAELRRARRAVGEGCGPADGGEEGSRRHRRDVHPRFRRSGHSRQETQR